MSTSDLGQLAAHFAPLPWRAGWIWAAQQVIAPSSPFHVDHTPQPPAHAQFRKGFTLDSLPKQAPARIAADSRYRLYLNGHLLGHGPIRAQPRRMVYDIYDLVPYLRLGENVLDVQVKYYGRTNAFWMPAPANARLGKSGALVFEADLGGIALISDATWAARLDPAYGAEGGAGHMVSGGVPGEFYDARLAPPDAQGWQEAQVLMPVHMGATGRAQPPSDPYGALHPRPIAALGGETLAPSAATICQIAADFPAANSPAARLEASVLAHPDSLAAPATWPLICADTGARYTRIRLDFGRVVAGFVDFDLTADAGTILNIAFHESPITAPDFFGAHGGVRYIAAGGAARHRVFDKRGFRYAYIAVQCGAGGTAALHSFSVAEDLYPWAGAADFTCDLPDMNRLYAAGLRTAQLNSWDAFLDCPTREQRAWVGDSVVPLMVHLARNADLSLCWRALDLGDSPRPDGILPMSVAGDVEADGGFTIPDYALHWLHGLHQMWRYTGDAGRVLAHLPSAARILRWFMPYLNSAGRLEHLPEWNLVDWAALHMGGESAIATALYARALAEYADMAQALGEAGSAQWARGVYARIAAGFEGFWDSARGLYVDHIAGGARHPAASQLPSALAIVAGLAPQDRWADMIDAITNPATLVRAMWAHPPDGADPAEGRIRFGRMIHGGHVPDWDVQAQVVQAQPFMSYVVHDAVARAGRADMLPQLLAQWLPHLEGGYDSFGENWARGSRAHGWSSIPARDIIAYIAGITPLEAGFARARIAPRLGVMKGFGAGQGQKITAFRASQPCPQGMISLALKGGLLTIDSPVPVQLDLHLELDLDGRGEDLPAGRHIRAL